MVQSLFIVSPFSGKIHKRQNVWHKLVFWWGVKILIVQLCNWNHYKEAVQFHQPRKLSHLCSVNPLHSPICTHNSYLWLLSVSSCFRTVTKAYDTHLTFYTGFLLLTKVFSDQFMLLISFNYLIYLHPMDLST